MEQARTIVDYAEQDNAKEMRDALYSAISDRVMAHIETHKAEVAKNLMGDNVQPEAEAEAS